LIEKEKEETNKEEKSFMTSPASIAEIESLRGLQYFEHLFSII